MSMQNIVSVCSIVKLSSIVVLILDHCKPTPTQITTKQMQQYSYNTFTISGAVAQWVECWTCDQQVVGSDPTRGKAA